MSKANFIIFIRLHYANILLGLIIVFYLINSILYSQSQSITSDEGSFYDYAIRYIKGNPDRVNPVIDNSKMPVVVLNLIPRAAEQILHPGIKKNDGGAGDIMNARYVTLIISVFIILLVYTWANQLYGKAAGLFAAFLMSLCPNNIANAGLVTTDSYSVLFLLATTYFLWKFCNHRNIKYFILFSLFTALSQLVKQSLFHLYLFVPILLLIYYFIKRPHLKFSLVIKYAVIFILINLLIINAGYYFYHTGRTLGSYHFMSNLFQSVQQIFPSRLPLPFPQPFIDGLDMAKYYDQVGGGYEGISSFGKVTILGKSAIGAGFWYYYFVTLFYKTPVSYIILSIWSICILIRKSTLQKFIEREFFLLLPVLYFIFILSFLYKTQCGIRHIIFIYPFLFIFSSGIIPFVKRTVSKATLAALSLFLIVSVLFYWKNYYPYTNELIRDKKNAYTYVGAGNLDFRGGIFFYMNYFKNHPEVSFVTEQPRTGIYLISVADYMDLWSLHKYDWLTHIKPFGVVACNGLLIEVKENDLHNKEY